MTTPTTDDPRPATRDKLGEYDAIETLKPGEPVFPLQGGDPFAPATVQFWVDQVRAAAMSETDRKKAEPMLRKASDAERVGWQMTDYQRGAAAAEEQAKAAAPQARPAYTGWQDSADEDTLARRKERAGRIAATGTLHNCIALCVDVTSQLAALRCCPSEEVLIREAVERLQIAAREIEPRRGTERS